MVVSNRRHDDRSRQNLRIPAEVLARIDALRKCYPGKKSRNTWITEAIMEKLARSTSKYESDNMGGMENV